MQNDFTSMLDPSGVRPFVEDDGEWVNLRFDYSTIQSSMHKDDPCRLELEYTRAMLLFLLFVPRPASILMIGLGGGSLPKYCHRYMPGVEITVVEINPHVIALRDQFMVPPDGSHFRVVQADGAQYVADAVARGRSFDVLMVDGFNFNGPSAQLETAAFFAACRAVLAPQGIMTVNLDSEESSSGGTVGRLRDAFGGGVIDMLADGGTNRIVFAADAALVTKTRQEARQRLASLPAVHQATMNRRSTDRERWPLIDDGRKTCHPGLDPGSMLAGSNPA